MEYEAKVTSSSLRVYASASTKAKSLGTLKKGALVTVVATCGDWARVKKGERVGYCALGSLEKYVDPYAYLKDGRYSNEKTIYTFLTKEMKLSPPRPAARWPTSSLKAATEAARSATADGASASASGSTCALRGSRTSARTGITTMRRSKGSCGF